MANTSDIRRPRILCVDDQQEILDLLTRQLGDEFDVSTCLDPNEALAIIDDNDPFTVVVADYAMPRINGVEFLARVKDCSPDTARIMLTAFDDLDIAISALHQGNIFRFLRKPWARDDLKRALADAVEQFDLVNGNRVLTARLKSVNERLDGKVRELDELNRLLEYWVEFSPVVLYSAECDARPVRLTYVSRNFAQLSGHERTEIIVDPGFWSSLIHPEDRDQAGQSFDDALANQSLTEFQSRYRIRHRTGAYLSVLDAFRVLRSPSGEPLEIVGAWLATEISQQRDVA